MNAHLLVGIAVLALVLAVPTAAVSVQSDTAGPITLESTSPYASVDGGELSLDFDRLNDRAVTETDEAFSITATDDTIESVRIESDADGLAFYEDGDPNAEITDSSPLELDAGDVVTVGVSVDTNVALEGTETFTIVVSYAEDDDDGEDASSGGTSGASPPIEDPEKKGENVTAASIEQTDLEASPTALETGETVTVTATYENVGNETGVASVEFAVDGDVVGTETVELAPSESETVSFEWTPDEPGTYDLTVDGVSAGTVEVTEPGPFAIETRELSASMTAALAPPLAVGLFLALTRAGRRW
ncbi:CARDB domain-containing protein [Natrarchaeobius chitinivorans]|uniref:Cell adhesion protein n=1 Tax=Natrarchaeobius chitinivorans TaxID=1679083 RepID=A0A3N6P7V9_NATCH|nr:CARDB domain-containing protein [Natrarchaeobius chitinivorans]RQG92095.1 cell adhesion protein [Natrarchaeobius chitinivorans]